MSPSPSLFDNVVIRAIIVKIFAQKRKFQPALQTAQQCFSRYWADGARSQELNHLPALQTISQLCISKHCTAAQSKEPKHFQAQYPNPCSKIRRVSDNVFCIGIISSEEWMGRVQQSHYGSLKSCNLFKGNYREFKEMYCCITKCVFTSLKCVTNLQRKWITVDVGERTSSVRAAWQLRGRYPNNLWKK